MNPRERDFRSKHGPLFSVKSQEDEAIKARVFVGNLPTDHMEGPRELEEMFEKYGEIHDVATHKGFGFVQFGTREAAQKCVQAVNGSIYKNLRLDVVNLQPSHRKRRGCRGHREYRKVARAAARAAAALAVPTDTTVADTSFSQSASATRSKIADRNVGKSTINGGQQTGNSLDVKHAVLTRDRRNDERERSPLRRDRGDGSSGARPGGPNIPSRTDQDREYGDRAMRDQPPYRGDREAASRALHDESPSYRDGAGHVRDIAPSPRDAAALSARSREMGRDWQQQQSQSAPPGGGRENYNDGYDRGGPVSARYDGSAASWESYGGEPMQRQQHRDQMREPKSGDFGALAAAEPILAASTAKPPFDCLIACHQQQRGYCEMIERRLRALHMSTSVHVPKDKEVVQDLLEEATSRGVPFAIIVTSQNEVHRSLTLSILHGTPQEHRNMPLEDAMGLVARNFDEYVESIRRKQLAAASIAGPTHVAAPVLTGPLADYDVPDSDLAYLLNLMADGRPLTLSELDLIIGYVQRRRDKAANSTKLIASSEPRPDVVPDKNLMKQQTDLQAKILSLLGGGQSAVLGGLGPAGLHGSLTSAAGQQQQQGQPNPLRYGGGTGGFGGAGAQQGGSAPAAQPAAGTINFDNPMVQRALENLITSGPSLLQNIKGLAPGPQAPKGGQQGRGNYNSFF